MSAELDQSTERQWTEGRSPLCEVRDLEMSENTPGPWKFIGPNVNDERQIQGADKSSVAVTIPVGNPDRFPERSAANARLVAASPELLEALEATTRELIGERDCLYESVSLPDGTVPDGEDQAGIAELDRVIDQARSAIKKARGEQ